MYQPHHAKSMTPYAFTPVKSDAMPEKTAQKIADLRKISDFYHLNLTIEEVKP